MADRLRIRLQLLQYVAVALGTLRLAKEDFDPTTEAAPMPDFRDVEDMSSHRSARVVLAKK
ncbi:MAG: hypothetical protein B7Z37_02865 [Verrucomicrobia bacterium 12-59-8]|nr:MAG: hypothetical protein B7Z37_02865 [Verrucomicrobia bacterium 12-59-8]